MKSFFLLLLQYFVVPCGVGLVAVWLRRRRPWLRGASQRELRARLREVLERTPLRPPLLCVHTGSPASLLVDARLLAGCPSQALDEIEQRVVKAPRDGAAFVALAKALLYCRREEEAKTALLWAQRLGADDAELDYLRARLGRGDEEALRLCLRACRRQPGYPEALYLLGRLALRLGFAAEGRALLRAIAPLMHLSVERISYRRDLEQVQRGLAHPAGRLLRLLRAAPQPRSEGRPPQSVI